MMKQKFAQVVRAYIHAKEATSSKFSMHTWWGGYQEARKSLNKSWRLRGGICTRQHVRACFKLLTAEAQRPSSASEGESWLHTICGLHDAYWGDQSGDPRPCYFSRLNTCGKDDLKKHLPWILYWGPDPQSAVPGRTILVGKKRTMPPKRFILSIHFTENFVWKTAQERFLRIFLPTVNLHVGRLKLIMAAASCNSVTRFESCVLRKTSWRRRTVND